MDSTTRAYVIPQQPYDACVVNSPCILDAIFNTALGTTTYSWTMFDGVTAGGTVISMGTIVPVSISQLGLPLLTGLYFQALVGATNSGWTFIVRLLPQGNGS